MTNIFKKILPLLIVSVFLIGCGKQSSAPETSGQKPRVVATTTMLADMARQIGGDDIEVIGLMAPGVDPHTYELPARAIGHLNSADLVIYNGMLLEGKMEELIIGLESKGIATFAATSVVPNERRFSAKDIGDEHGDPHVWGDAEIWASVISPCADAIAKLVPEDKRTTVEKRAAEYERELIALHDWILLRIAEIPKEQRLLVTSHDAFNYLGRAYEIEVIGVQGISTATDAGIADIVATVDLIKARNIRAIFVENSVDPSVIERIAKDSGVKIGGELFSDSCGPSGDIKTVGGEKYDTGTYVGMMKHNINTIVEALK